VPHPPLFLRALAAGTLAALLATPAAYADPGDAVDRTAAARVGTAATAAVSEEDATPLAVQLSTLSTSQIPTHGSIRVTGVVTNRSDERWTGINMHAFLDDTPITTPQDLDAAADLPATAVVGSRITVIGMFDSIGGLDPGQSAPFSIRLKHSVLALTEPGVYWFGVHALGQSPSQPSDSVADGRARTFLPFMPPPEQKKKRSEPQPALDVALVVPVRHRIDHAPNGRIASPGAWAHALSSGGSLAAATEIGAAAGGRPITWALDPAVPEAVRRLVAGNPSRNLDDTVRDGQDQEPPPTDEPSSDASSTAPTSAPQLPQGQHPDNAAVAPGKEWLAALKDVLGFGETLTLPYGDLDVSAAAFHMPQLLDQARKHSERVDLGGVPTRPAVLGADGFLDPAALRSLPGDVQVVLGSQMTAGTKAAGASSITVEGRQVAVASSPTAQGGPGPDDPRTALAMRQRIVSAAAVRLLTDPQQPLVVVLPQGWSPADLGAFFPGLDVPWVHLATLDQAMAGDAASRDVAPDRLTYPQHVARRSLPAANFTAAGRLIDAGQRLENVLTRNDRLGAETLEEALTDLSVQTRATADRTRVRTDASADWLRGKLRDIRVTAPSGVTLSSASGTFAAILRNRLDHPVTVSLAVSTDPGLEVAEPGSFDLAAKGRRTVVLEADVHSVGVHYVQLSVTDQDGAPLGATARVPIRSSQYGKVIWLITGAGLGLLLLAWIRQRTRPRSQP
jgi:hypothetical protein